MATGLITNTETLPEPEINWLYWIISLAAGFITGATVDMAALWLFAQWFQTH